MNIIIKNTILQATISTLGAELQSVIKKETGREYIWYGKEEFWTGRSPILFPFVGRLLDDEYFIGVKRYSLPKHGFARKKEFILTNKGESFAEFTLSDDEDTIKNYPYHFELVITFELVENKIKVNHKVVNKNDAEMYFSLGAHPAFNIEIGDKLVFEKKENFEAFKMDENSILKDKKEYLGTTNEIVITNDIFKKDAIMFENLKSNYLFINCKGENIVKFNLNNAPLLGIWAKPGAPYVCIEPWYGIDDNAHATKKIEDKFAIEKLEKGEEFNYFWDAEII